MTTWLIGAMPGRCSPARWPMLARRDQGRHRAGQLSRLRLRDPLANHLGQQQLRDRPRPLPLQARAVLVRGAQTSVTELDTGATRACAPTLVFLLYQKGRDDYTVKSGPQRVRDLMGEEAEELL